MSKTNNLTPQQRAKLDHFEQCGQDILNDPVVDPNKGVTPQQAAALDRFEQCMSELSEHLGLGPDINYGKIEEALRAQGFSLPTIQ